MLSKSIGKNKIFICSKVLSFTLENALKKAILVSEYKKCSSVPNTQIPVAPKTCQIYNLFFIKTPYKQYM